MNFKNIRIHMFKKTFGITATFILTLPFFANSQTIEAGTPKATLYQNEISEPNLLFERLSRKEQTNLLINEKLKPLIQVFASARGGGDAGGGNATGLRFYALISQGLFMLNDKHIPEGTSKTNLFDLLSKTKVAVTREELYTNGVDGTQPCDAINFPSLNLIVINESRINAISDMDLIRSLGVHELLSIAGKESSGRYSHSVSVIQKFEFGNFEYENLPKGTRFIFSKPLLFNIGLSHLNFDGDLPFRISNPHSAADEQIIVESRTCKFNGHAHAENESFLPNNLPYLRSTRSMERLGCRGLKTNLTSIEANQSADNVCSKLTIDTFFCPGRMYTKWTSQWFKIQAAHFAEAGIFVVLPAPRRL